MRSSSVCETSVEAWREVLESGYVRGKQREILMGLAAHGPCTGSELFYALDMNRNVTHSNIVTRLGELRDKGVVEERGKKVCTKTGKRAIVWTVNRGAPAQMKPDRIRCESCKGKGYREQGRFI